jgi:hypothetical protein
MIMAGENYLDSPHLLLRGANATKTDTEIPGEFFIIATDGKALSRLVGKPDGEFTWQGKNIVRSINNIPADIYGNVPFDVPVKSVNGKTGEVNISVPDSPGYPDYAYKNADLGTLSTYKALQDGWINVYLTEARKHYPFFVFVNDVLIGSEAGEEHQTALALIPVKKGDIVKTTEDSSGKTAREVQYKFFPKR